MTILSHQLLRELEKNLIEKLLLLLEELVIGWIEMIYVLWIISLGLLYYFLESRKKNRINELIDLIEDMRNQNYKIPMKQDGFSILEDKIYKLFIEIVEAKETTSKNSEKQI